VSFLRSLFRFLGLDLWAELERSSSVVRQQEPAPMDTEALARIEEILHLRLPEWYRSAMLSYRPLNPMDGEILVNDAVELTNVNLELRRDGFFDMAWPGHYLWIGGDGAGNGYFLDLQQKGTAVFFADHEARRYVQEEVNFEKWCRNQGLAVASASSSDSGDTISNSDLSKR
jgi:hypothetical protein